MSIDTREEIAKSNELCEKEESLKMMRFCDKLNLIIDSGDIKEFKEGASQLVSKYCKTDDILDILPPEANKELDVLVNQIIIGNEIKLFDEV